MKNRITSAGTDAHQSDAAEVPMSSQPCSNTFVIGSQSPPMLLDDAISALSVKENYVDLKTFLDLIMHCLKNVQGFYEWLDKQNKSKENSVAVRLKEGFYINLTQIRELYSDISSNAKLVSPPS